MKIKHFILRKFGTGIPGYLIGLAVIFQCHVHAQDYTTDMDKLTAKMESIEACHVISTVTMYDTKENLSVIQSFTAELKRSDLFYRSKIDDIEIVSNQNMFVVIDHEEKLIQLQKVQKLSKAEQTFLKEFYEIDSISDVANTVDCVQNTDTEVVYQITLPKGLISSVQISIDKTNWVLKKLEYQYNSKYYPSGNFVVIEYQKFDLEPDFAKSEFSGSEFIEQRGNSFVLTAQYKDWELINQYNLNTQEK